MLKAILLTGSMLIAAPALAQTAPSSSAGEPGRTPMTTAPANTVQSQPAPTTSTAPTGDAITAQTSPATPAPTTPADPMVAAQPATPADPAAAAAQPATPAAPTTPSTATAAGQPAQPANQPTQVSQIVDKEFPSYDKDKDGKLSQAEFGAWMVALKTQSDPSTQANSPETTKWVGAAFAQADTGKTGALTKEQLVSFLNQSQS